MTEPYEWMANAACKGHDSEIFYPEKGDPISPAMAICAECPVANECLAYALQLERDWPSSYGVWGATSAAERRRILLQSGGGDRVRCPECGRHVLALLTHRRQFHAPISEHGTDRGYRQHYTRGERPCGACMAGHAAYSRQARQQRNAARRKAS